jgi:acetylglutamate kinase
MDLIPVVSTVGSDSDGQAYNINADTAVAIADRRGARAPRS